jgi:release factor glutamine methyltransferase
VKPALNIAMKSAGPELRSVLAEGMRRLEAADVPSAALAAELLLMHVLQRDRAWLYAHSECELDHDQAEGYWGLVERRSEGVPTQYLTGRQEFWGLEFEVGPGVLIPRPETEHVIEVALERLDARRDERLHVADVGTGSGCIAIALARELPNARIVATDISAAALDYARRNAARNGAAEQIDFFNTNLLDAVVNSAEDAARASFDLIVSNPPYVARTDAVTLPREVREHEPAEALFAGDNGLDMFAPLIGAAARTLAPGGIFVVEIGYNSAEYVGSLLSSPRWCELRITRDLAGIERVISARLDASPSE